MTIAVRAAKSFGKHAKKLSIARREAVAAAVKSFAANPETPGLNFEAVTGRKGYYTIRSGIGDRVLLRKTGPQAYDLVAVGNHDLIYRTYFKK
jgi:mRNA-degrading endonuclease RelE of RelBE toxin-antitoxin system